MSQVARGAKFAEQTRTRPPINERASAFPDPEAAPADGPLAYSKTLTTEQLIDAYQHGIFPWFNSDRQPVLWWSPNPRAVLEPAALHISRSLAKRLRSRRYDVSVDTAFAATVAGCAAPRRGQRGTWITPRMAKAYQRLFEIGLAHSVEVWRDGVLIGGVYGVSLGRMFFAESMFSRAPDASKVALAHLGGQLLDWDFTLIDCQLMSDHLRRLGAVPMPRREFLGLVAANRDAPTRPGPWRLTAAPRQRPSPRGAIAGAQDGARRPPRTPARQRSSNHGSG